MPLINRLTVGAAASLIAVPVLVGAGLAMWQLAPQMPLAAQYAALCVVAYLIGSVSWGYTLLILARGEDIRAFGSGRTGMSNTLRTAGGKAAVAVFVLDCSKGVLAVLLARFAIGPGPPEIVAGLVTLCGHNWPVFLGFRGGRGILPGLGGLSVMAPWVALGAAALFAVVTLSTRYLSLGSIVGTLFTAAASLALTLWWGHDRLYTAYACIGAALILWQHRDNIRRLLSGTERRLGAPAQRN